MRKNKREFAERICDTLKNLEEADITISKNYLMTYFNLMKDPKKSLTDIRLELDISQATMWRIIQKFEDLGLGKKVQDSFDHHVYYFKPFKYGEDLLANKEPENVE